MSHLNPSPNQTKTKTQSERQNWSERNREERESKSERRERGRCSQPHTTCRRRRSLAHNPQPICYNGSWPLHCATTIGPPYNPAKTHNPQPSCHHCHDQATNTVSPPSREIGKESPDLMREVWVFRERSLSFLRESWWNPINNDLWPTATVAFKVVVVEKNGREKEKVRMTEKEEKRKKWEEREGESDREERENDEIFLLK